MARGYRAILELPEKEDALEVSYQLFHKWLNDKYMPPERERSIEFDDDGIYRFGELTRRSKGQIEEVTVTRLRESSKDRHYHRQLLEVVDTSNRNGRWTTRMYSMTATKESRYHQVIWVEVIPPASSEEPAQRPNLVVDLVKSYDVHESGVSISDRVQNIVDEGQVDQLTDSIFNQQRRVAIVVAAPISDENDCEAHDQWREVLNTLTDDSFGCASYFLLKPDVYDYFCQQVGDLKLEQGCLRTYLPKVNLEDETDPKRHRILTSSTLYHGLDGKTKKFRRELSQIIARTPCSYIWEKGLDGELKSAQDVLNKQRMKVPTFRLPLSSEVRTEGTEEAEVSAVKVVEDTVQAVLARKKTKGTALRPREQAATLQTQQVASDIQRTDRSGRPQWAAPLIELIRRFAPMFDPRTHDDMSDGVEALSAGLSVIDERYNDLAQKVHKLTQGFQGEKNKLQKEIDAYEALFEQSEENSKAAERVAELEEKIEEQEIARSYDRDERLKLEKENRRLRHQLKDPEVGLQDYDYEEENLDKSPADMATLFDWMTADGMYPQVREYVVFCDPDRMCDAILDLNDMSGNSRYAADFWKFILVLRDYMRAVEAGDFSGCVHDYLDKSIGVYRACSQKRHSPTESETVQNNGKMRRERTFPVPTEVDPRGEIEMFAHFKTSHRDTNDPRMHYYADTRYTHKVYIGYIGPHLTNTKTN
ncbi:MAG: hypothetical protein ACFN4L_04890 [Pauljensenia sp.]